MTAKDGSPPPRLAGFAGELLRDNYVSIINLEQGVRKGDVNAIHDMRVGIRRMRNALNNFSTCLPKEDRKQLVDALKTLATSLGKVRDLDVLIGSLKNQKKKIASSEQQAVKGLIKRARVRRRRNLKSLKRFMDGPVFASLKNEKAMIESIGGVGANGETV